MKNALVFGATGLVGSLLLRELLADPAYGRVTAVVRKRPAITDPRLDLVIAELATLPAEAARLVADDVFIALGTTKARTPDRAEYYRIDHDYPVLAARLAKANGATTVCLVSAVGADAASKVFYLRTKGETERDLIALGYAHAHVFRPSQLLGDRTEHRPLEKLLMAAWPALGALLPGRLEIYRGIAAADVARAMHAAASAPAGKLTIHHWREMKALARRDNAR
jgi:uncharacterized protein YbjT (DUF2867 family)